MATTAPTRAKAKVITPISARSRRLAMTRGTTVDPIHRLPGQRYRYGGSRTEEGRFPAGTNAAHLVWRMIQRRAAELGMRIRIGWHTFRAMGITAYLEITSITGASPAAPASQE